MVQSPGNRIVTNGNPIIPSTFPGVFFSRLIKPPSDSSDAPCIRVLASTGGLMERTRLEDGVLGMLLPHRNGVTTGVHEGVELCFFNISRM